MPGLDDVVAGLGGGGHHAEAQLPEKRRPIGVVFIEVQRPRDAQHAARGGVLLQRWIGKEPLALIGGHVRRGAGFSRGAEGLFAAVARDVPPPAGEGVDREHTVVFAAAAARGLPISSETPSSS